MISIQSAVSGRADGSTFHFYEDYLKSFLADWECRLAEQVRQGPVILTLRDDKIDILA